jgi:hypothetical protein
VLACFSPPISLSFTPVPTEVTSYAFSAVKVSCSVENRNLCTFDFKRKEKIQDIDKMSQINRGKRQLHPEI